MLCKLCYGQHDFITKHWYLWTRMYCTNSQIWWWTQVGANYWSAMLLSKNKTHLRGKENAVAVCAFLGLCFRQAKPSCWVCTLSDSPWLTVRCCSWRQRFPKGAPSLSNCCFSCQKTDTSHPLKRTFMYFPGARKIKCRCFSRHTNQPTKSFLPCPWFVLFFSSPDFQHKSQSAVMFGRMLFYFWFLHTTGTLRLGASAVYSVTQVGAHKSATEGRNTVDEMMPDNVITV